MSKAKTPAAPVKVAQSNRTGKKIVDSKVNRMELAMRYFEARVARTSHLSQVAKSKK